MLGVGKYQSEYSTNIPHSGTFCQLQYFKQLPIAETVVANATLVFSGLGVMIGAITSIFKKSMTFQINGDSVIWENFRNLLPN